MRWYTHKHALPRKGKDIGAALSPGLFCLSILAPESARMFCQRSCWLLNMIDRRICVCCISPVHHQPPVACQTLCLPVAYQRASLSKNPQRSTESLYKHSLSPSSTSPPHLSISSFLPSTCSSVPPPPCHHIEVSARSCKKEHDCNFY